MIGGDASTLCSIVSFRVFHVDSRGLDLDISQAEPTQLNSSLVAQLTLTGLLSPLPFPSSQHV